MTNLPIRFLSVTITNFRGVSGTLTVPLDASLTVIHAANGTGKSSICYAIEWLLTGVVNDVSATDLACLWGKDVTTVSADCFIGEQRCQLSRRARKLFLITVEGSQQITDADLLSMLTPSSVSGKSSAVSKNSKRNWLRSSRWLYSNALALLVDNSRASDREQIFADILGFGHLTELLQKLKDYRKALPSTSGLSKKVGELQARIAELDLKIKKASPFRENFDGKLSQVFELINYPEFYNSVDSNKRVETARQRTKEVELSFQEKLVSIAKVYEHWSSHSEQQDNLDEVRSKLSSLNEQKLKFEKAIAEANGHLAKVNSDWEAAERSVVWAKEKLSKILTWEPIINFAISNGFVSNSRFIDSDLRGAFVELSWQDVKRDEWRKGLEFLSSKIDLIVYLLSQKEILASEATFVVPPSDIPQLERVLQEARDVRVGAEAAFNHFSSTIEKLKALGRSVVESHSDGHCPLCEHDWSSKEKLVNILEENGLDLSPFVSASAAKLQAAQEAEVAARSTLELGRGQLTAYESFGQKVRDIDTQLKEIGRKSNYFAVMNVSDFSGISVERVEFLTNRVNTAIAIDAVLKALADATPVFGVDPYLPVTDKVSALVVKLKEYEVYYSSQEQEQAIEKTKCDLIRKDLHESLQPVVAELESWNSSLQVVLFNMNDFNSSWGVVAGERPVSIEAYTSVLEEIEVQRVNIQRATDLLLEVEAAVSIDADLKSLKSLQDEELVLSRKLDHGTQYVAEADRVIDLYSDHVRQLTSSSLSPILQPAVELFARMHANEVYKGLSFSSGTDLLQWTAIAEGFEDSPVDAEKRFSQGQRQDLALSLYLSRARGIGGSFFLDEPIAHLDDLNRVAMLDIFRMIANTMPNMNLILTTSSDSLVRHVSQKFSTQSGRKLFRTIHLDGNPKNGVSMRISEV